MKKLALLMVCSAAVAACGCGKGPAALDQGEMVSIVEVTDATNDGCQNWNANLTACKPYRCVYAGSSGALLGREILGAQNGKCAYREQISPDRALQCALPQKKVQDMARYYRTTEVAEDVELSVMQLADGTVVYQETIDGQPVKTPLQQALSDKSCKLMTVQKNNGSLQLFDLQFGQGKDTENIIL